MKNIETKSYSRCKDPVRPRDLDANFLGIIQMGVSKKELELYVEHFKKKFGTVLKVCLDGFKDEQVDDAAKMGLYLWVWGYNPYERMYEFPGKPQEIHNQWLNKFGRKFLGYETGEEDGRYIGAYSKRYREKRKGESYYTYMVDHYKQWKKKEREHKKHELKNLFHSRQEACHDFFEWHKPFVKELFHRMIMLNSLNLTHYYGEMGARLLGAELALSFMNHQLWFSFIRGAARQYGLLFQGVISMWRVAGYAGCTCVGTAESHMKNFGLYKGTSVNLARTIWYIAYMYGASMLGMEMAYFKKSIGPFLKGKIDKYPPLSQIGQIQLDGIEWCRKHPNRGIHYTPVCLLFDYYHGWLPPKHCYQYSGEKRLVWGTIPYDKGDHQIDNFFRWVFPGYVESGFHRDDRGFFVPTPFGDIFDSILNNADIEILKRYKIIILMGNQRVDRKLLNKLRRLVAQGLDLILSCDQIDVQDTDFYGLKKLSSINRGNSTRLNRGKTIKESPFTCFDIEINGAKVLLKCGNKPIVLLNKFGKGRVITITSEYWMTDKLIKDSKRISPPVIDSHSKMKPNDFYKIHNANCPYNCEITNMLWDGRTIGEIRKKVCVDCRVDCTNEIPHFYKILKGIKKVLAPYLRSSLPIEIKGGHIHYMVNLTGDKKKIIVTLANHTRSVWKGQLSTRGDNKIIKVREWITDKKADERELKKITISSRRLKIFEVSCKKDVL